VTLFWQFVVIQGGCRWRIAWPSIAQTMMDQKLWEAIGGWKVVHKSRSGVARNKYLFIWIFCPYPMNDGLFESRNCSHVRPIDLQLLLIKKAHCYATSG
jgi:hypothetical protein